MEKKDIIKYDSYIVVHLSLNCDENVISWEEIMLFEISGYLSFLQFYLTTSCKYFVIIYCDFFLHILLRLRYFLSALLIANYETLSKVLTILGYPKILFLFTSSVL